MVPVILLKYRRFPSCGGSCPPLPSSLDREQITSRKLKMKREVLLSVAESVNHRRDCWEHLLYLLGLDSHVFFDFRGNHLIIDKIMTSASGTSGNSRSKPRKLLPSSE